jgi:serine/threonine-protein kinase
MTPEYASPEQVRGMSVTTATDIYSLGVVLYELLTGNRPHRLRSQSSEETLREICEVEPLKPSKTIADREPSTSEKSDGGIAERRPKIRPSISNRQLQGDLDNIVLMALRKEPQRRYESAAQFSADVQRHLGGLPVIARKDTFKYRATKFVRRNRAGVAAAVIILLSLVGGAVATIWQARAAARQARIATEQRDRAQLEKSKAESINAFMQRMFASANPSWYAPGHGKRGDVKVVEVLDDASQRIDTEMKDQPEVRAEVHHTIGDTYLSLGAATKAEQQFRLALELYRGVYGERHAKVAESIFYLAGALFWENEFKSAEPLYRQAIAMMRELDQGNVNLPYMLEDYGSILAQRGDEADAAPLLNEALELFRKRYGDDHFTIASVYGAIGNMHMVRGEMELAEPKLQEAIDRFRRLGVEDGSRLVLVDLGVVHELKGDLNGAEALYRRALEVARKSLGENHLTSSFPLFYLAKLHDKTASYKEAETEARNALEIRRQNLADEDPYVTQALGLLSKILITSGSPARAEPYLRQALALHKTASSNGRRDDLTEVELGECLLLLGRYAEAEPLLKESYEDLNASYGERSPYTIEAQSKLARLQQSKPKS